VRLFDVNILVGAFREDAPNHAFFYEYLDRAVNDRTPFGYSPYVLSGFLRIVTHPRVFASPTPIDSALRFSEDMASRENARRIESGPRHFGIFADYCRRTNATGNLIPDAWFAALATESGCTWITADRDYGLFPGLDWVLIIPE
jgi:uncharacterized protein